MNYERSHLHFDVSIRSEIDVMQVKCNLDTSIFLFTLSILIKLTNTIATDCQYCKGYQFNVSKHQNRLNSTLTSELHILSWMQSRTRTSQVRSSFFLVSWRLTTELHTNILLLLPLRIHISAYFSMPIFSEAQILLKSQHE